MYIYHSPIGNIEIIYDRNTNTYLLAFDKAVYGRYVFIEEVVSDVYNFNTNNDDWDLLAGTIPDVPTNIFDWKINNPWEIILKGYIN